MTEIVKCDNGLEKRNCEGIENSLIFPRLIIEHHRLNSLYQNIPLNKFHIGNGYIESVLDKRKDQLFIDNTAYLAHKER